MIRHILSSCGENPVVKSFPKLMRHRTAGSIALFYNFERATILVQGNLPTSKSVGYCDGYYDSRYWDDYNEPLTIQNV